MQEIVLPKEPDTISAPGSLVRLLLRGARGGMIQSTVPVGRTSRPIAHRSVYEIWYVLEGAGELWRSNGAQEKITALTPGTSIDLEPGTAFQFRNVSPDADLKFICVTMPAWPGEDEAVPVPRGAWEPSV